MAVKKYKKNTAKIKAAYNNVEGQLKIIETAIGDLQAAGQYMASNVWYGGSRSKKCYARMDDNVANQVKRYDEVVNHQNTVLKVTKTTWG